MANRETYPASQSPLQGDVSGAAGATKVTVVGLQGTPIAAGTPSDQAELTYIAELGEYVPTVPTYTVALEDINNGLSILSSDWDIYVNGIGNDVIPNWAYGFAFQIFLNGVGVTGSGQ